MIFFDFFCPILSFLLVLVASFFLLFFILIDI